MLLIVFTVALVAGTTQLSAIATVFSTGSVGLRVSLALGMVAFLVVATAENARIPIDNPATHLELTMVHEAMVLEYSGRHLAMIELAAMLKLLLTVSLIGCIFFPFGLAHDPSGYAAGLAAWLVKLAVMGALLGTAESGMAKLRVFRVPGLLSVALMLGLLGVMLLFIGRGL